MKRMILFLSNAGPTTTIVEDKAFGNDSVMNGYACRHSGKPYMPIQNLPAYSFTQHIDILQSITDRLVKYNRGRFGVHMRLTARTIYPAFPRQAL